MSSSDTDWLDEETSKLPVRRTRRTSRVKRPKPLILAERKLTSEQRYYVRMLTESLTVAEAERRMASTGYPKRCRETYWRWRQKPDFAEALSLMTDWQLKAYGISKERLIMDAEKIKQHALEEQPILYKGDATGYMERELGIAMRAVEFQGKGLGITDPDQRGVKVNIDIDFSGRAAGVTIEGEFEETMAVE